MLHIRGSSEYTGSTIIVGQVSYMMNKHKLDIVSLSEMWLKIVKLSLNMYKMMVTNLNSKIESQNPEAELFSTLKNI